MKHLFYLLCVGTILFSCKKEFKTESKTSLILEQVRASLKDSLTSNEFSNLNFENAILSKSDANQLYFLRIPFDNKKITEDFLIVKTNSRGNIEAGRIIHLERNDPKAISEIRWDGFISIRSLAGQNIIRSTIINGYIASLHPNLFSKSSLMEPVYPENVMPEVVIVAYVDNGGISYSTWLWLTSLFYNSDNGGGGGGGYYYGSTGGGGYYGEGYYSGGYYGGGGTGGSSGSGGATENLKEFETETIYNVPDVDVWKMFNCFSSVPNDGATYTIKLCADIPSNGNPQASSTNSAISAGHSFLTVTKTNGSSIITQSFGFYPMASPSWLDPFANVTSTMKNNGNNEFNASIEMTISESQFNIIRNYAISFSTKPYNLGNYNCTNYAMDIFNAVRTTPLSIDPYKIVVPGGPGFGIDEPNVISIEKSPQMLFTKLQQMKQSNDPEASRITIDQTHNSHAPNSHGECN